jgi:hypothetical protein
LSCGSSNGTNMTKSTIADNATMANASGS